MSDMYNQPQDEEVSPVSQAPLEVLKAPRRVPTSRAGSWIYQGFTVFNRGMGTSVGIVVVALLIQIVGNLLPGANLLLSIFSLVFAAGYLAVAHGGYTQGHLRFGNYFAGFRKNMGELVLASVIYLGLIFAVVFIGVFLGMISGGWQIFAHHAGGGAYQPNIDPLFILLWFLIILMFVIPLMMLVVYAPALIYFHDLKAWAAMKLSFHACWKNMLPLLWLGVLALLLSLLGVLMLFVGLLVVMPVLAYAGYFSYRDIFLYEDEVISV